ncbi:MPHOSPH6 family protein [Megaselia abdita]
MSSKAKPRLSKGILEMKFMMKSKVKVDKEIENDEGKSMYHNEITEKMGVQSNFIMEPSFVNIEELSVCRYSCRGMNPEIEKLLQNEQISKTDPKMETEVSDQELVHFYSKSNIGQGTTTKRKSKEDFYHKKNKKAKDEK